MDKLVVLGANPAWQRIATCAALRPGAVVRLTPGPGGAAGKGYNCALALRRLGRPVRLVSGLGSDLGPWRQACLEEGIELSGFPLSGSVRWATTLRDLESDTVTELVEEGPSASEGAGGILERELSADGDAILCACGTLPAGLDPEVVVHSLLMRSGWLVIDSIPLIRSLLRGGSDRSGLCLKLNESEWASVSATSSLEEQRRFVEGRCPGAHWIRTCGAQGTSAAEPGGAPFAVPAPPLPGGEMAHPIGAGDAFTAGFAHAWAGSAFREACLSGAAAAFASCRNPLPARLTRESYLQAMEIVSSHA